MARGAPSTVLAVAALAVPVLLGGLGAQAGPFDGRFDGYDIQQVPFAMVDLPAPVTPGLPDDDMTGQLDLGFSSRFYNDATANFWVGSNGFISLFKKEDAGCCEGGLIPSTVAPNGLIAGFWADLDPSAGGTVSFQTFPSLQLPGLEPQAAAVARWLDVPAPGGGTATFEVVFLEQGAWQVIVDHAAVPDGVNATIGAKGFNGLSGVQIARGALSLDHVAWRAVPVYTILRPDLVISNVRATPPLLPTDPWAIRVHAENAGLGPFLQAQVRLTATPAPGPLRGTSPGCTVLVGQKTLVQFQPGQSGELDFRWSAPLDLANPSAPRVGDYVFVATGVVVQTIEAELDTTNNAASATGSYVVAGQGGADALCQRVPELPSPPVDDAGGNHA